MSASLKTIRQVVPRTDRHEPAVAPSPAPQWARARDGSAYVHIYLFPWTLDELGKMAREYGNAAVANVQWGSVTVWLMNNPHGMDLRNPMKVASTAVMMVREYDRVRLGLPKHDGTEWDPPRLEFLSPEVRQEAELVAAETMEDWRKAGSPHLGRNHLRSAYLSLTSSPAFRNKYVLPMSENDNKEQA